MLAHFSSTILHTLITSSQAFMQLSQNTILSEDISSFTSQFSLSPTSKSMKEHFLVHTKASLQLLLLLHRSCFLATSYYKVFRLFGSKAANCPFHPFFCKNVVNCQAGPSLKATCFMEPVALRFS